MSKRPLSSLSEQGSNSPVEANSDLPPPPYTSKKRGVSTAVSSLHNGNGEWTPQKKEKFVDRILAIGMKHANLEELAAEFGLSKQQVRNAIQAGRKGNLRDKASKAVRGD